MQTKYCFCQTLDHFEKDNFANLNKKDRIESTRYDTYYIYYYYYLHIFLNQRSRNEQNNEIRFQYIQK